MALVVPHRKVLLVRQSLEFRAVKFGDEIGFRDVDTQDEMATALMMMS